MTDFNTTIIENDDVIAEELFELFKSFEVKYSKEMLIAFLVEQWSELLNKDDNALLQFDNKTCEIKWFDSDKDRQREELLEREALELIHGFELPLYLIPDIIKSGILQMRRTALDLNILGVQHVMKCMEIYEIKNTKPQGEDEM